MDPYSVPSEPLLDSFERYLRAANRADSTITAYLEGVRQAAAFLDRHGVPLADATRADLLTRRAPSTAATRYKQIRIFLRVAGGRGGGAEPGGQADSSDGARGQARPGAGYEELRRLFAVCAGKGFEARRDTALITFLLDTGARRAEIMA